MIRSLLTGTIAAIAFASVTLQAPAQAETPAALGQAQVDDSAFALGTLTRAQGAMTPNLWSGAEAAAVDRLLAALPRDYAEPAYFDLARRVLLSPGQGPQGATNQLAGTKLLAAAELGFYREAGELASLAPGLNGLPALAKVDALSALLDGDVQAACARGAGLTRGRTEAFFLKLRFLCYVQTGEDQAADLTLNLLTDQGILSEGDERIFSALANAAPLKGSISPEDAFQYAAITLLGAAVTPEALPELPGSVLAALARSAEADGTLRLAALDRALALRLIGPDEGMRLAADLAASDLAVHAVAVAGEIPGSLGQTTALAKALLAAEDWTQFRARAALFAGPLARLTPNPQTAPLGEIFALAALAENDPQRAERWLDAMMQVPYGEPVAKTPTHELAARLTAEGLPDARLPLSDPLADSDTDLPGLVEGALAAAHARSEGMAALVALTALGTAAEADSDAEMIRASLTADMLRRSGQSPLLSRRTTLDEAGPAALTALKGQTASGLPAPRLKPAP